MNAKSSGLGDRAPKAPAQSLSTAAQKDLRESRLRSLLKAITYRVTGTVTTAGIAFAVTGEMATALAIGAIESGVKVVVYYAHERVWQLVPRGTIRRLAHLGRA